MSKNVLFLVPSLENLFINAVKAVDCKAYTYPEIFEDSSIDGESSCWLFWASHSAHRKSRKNMFQSTTGPAQNIFQVQTEILYPRNYQYVYYVTHNFEPD